MNYKRLVALRDARVARLAQESKEMEQQQKQMEREQNRQQIRDRIMQP